MHERTRRLRSAASTAVLSKGLNLLTTVGAVSVVARHLSPEAYGLWATLTGSVSLFMLLDIGIASTLTNLISGAYAADDREAATRHFSNALAMVVGVAGLLGLVGFTAGSFVDWPRMFHVEHFGPGLVAPSVAVCFAVIVLALPAGLAARILAGYQELHIANLVAGAGSLLGLGCTVAAVAAHGSFPWLVAAFIVPTVVLNTLCLLWLMFVHKPWMRPALRHVTRPSVLAIFRSGGSFALIQVAGLVVFNSDNLIIAHFRGAAEVAPYSTASRLVTYGMAIQGILMPALWPALSEAYARGDLVWMRSTYARLRRFTLLTSAVASVLILTLGRTAIRLWTGGVAVPTETLLAWMCVWMAICSVTMNQSTLLGATSRVSRQAVASCLAAVFNLALSIVWVRRYGALGVLQATLLSYVIFILLVQTLEVRRILRGEAQSGDLPLSAKARLLARVRRVLRALVPLVYRTSRIELAPDWQPRRILLAHPGHIGDIVLATATIESLRSAFPQAEIGFVTGGWSTGVLAGHPAVRWVHRVDHWRLDRGTDSFVTRWRRFRRTRRTALDEIRDVRYDLFLALLNANPDLLNLGWAARIPVRAGFDTSFFAALATHTAPGAQPALLHQSLCQAGLLVALGIHARHWAEPQGWLPEYGAAEHAEVAALLGVRELAEARFRVVHVGAGAPMKEMSVQFWQEVAAALSQEHTLLFTGRGPREAAQIREITAGLPGCIDACDRLSWGALVTAIRHAEALYGVDSMAGHVAGAVGTPSIQAYHGAGGVARWRPLGNLATVWTQHLPCAPCHLPFGCQAMPCKAIQPADLLGTPVAVRARTPAMAFPPVLLTITACPELTAEEVTA